MEKLKYSKLLAEQYPNKAAASTEIINLKAILNLPKGTEHFLTDLHGEYEAFQHMLRTASGVLKFKIDDIFADTISETEKKQLLALITYPEDKLKYLHDKDIISEQWYKNTLFKVIKLCKVVASKYSRSKVRKALPKNFAYVLDELLHLSTEQLNKEDYYKQIIETIIEIGDAENFIISLSYLIQSFAVDKLHIIGDVFDRGPNPHKIIDMLKKHYNCDIQWGNHDILWMGAVLGQKSLIATAIRITLRYGNLKMLEEGYGINMRPLSRFAMEVYGSKPCKMFNPKLTSGSILQKEKQMIAQMHKAITIIQLKLEGNVRRRRPEFKMEEEFYLDKIDQERGVIKWKGEEFDLVDDYFPTIDPDNPYHLTIDEQEIIDQLSRSFKSNDKLQKHMKFLFNKGNIYLKYNNNLLYHGCVPMDEDGNFVGIEVDGKEYKGKEMFDFFAKVVKKSYSYKFEDEDYRDWLWYLWRGSLSPLFGKDRMATFFHYFTDEKSLHKETKNPYYKLRQNKEVCENILTEFGLDPQESHIINGHTPVAEKNGENPIKAEGNLLVIDGGMSTYYQPKTGIAGYTLIYNSYGLRLVSHKPFISRKNVIEEGDTIVSSVRVVEKSERKKIRNTDIGDKLSKKIADLMELLKLYKKGIIKEEEV